MPIQYIAWSFWIGTIFFNYVELMTLRVDSDMLVFQEYTKQVGHLFWIKVSLDPAGIEPGTF